MPDDRDWLVVGDYDDVRYPENKKIEKAVMHMTCLLSMKPSVPLLLLKFPL